MIQASDDIKLLHDEAAQLLAASKSDEEIISYIIAKGYERHYAENVLDNIKEDVQDRRNFWKTLFYGISFLIAGILVTVASRQFAISTGALFYLFYWGLIITGISIIIRAFIIFRK